MAPAAVVAAAGRPMLFELPARLGDSRQLAFEGPLPEADPAHSEPPHEATRAPTDAAPVVLLDRKARLALRLGDH
jgi:hypothetical protein